MARGIRGIRAAFADATDNRAPEVEDLPPDVARMLPGPDGKLVVTEPGMWPGAPVDRLPPGCPVTPLGVDGHNSYFVDGLGQLLAFDGLDKKRLIRLFRTTPNTLYYYWPRWSEPKKKRDTKPIINGLEVDDSCQCLEKAAAMRGLFDPAGKVRGRGAWADRYNRLIWHSGDRLFTVEGGKLKASATGEVDGLFYPRRPAIMEPWREPVSVDDSPAHDVLKMLKTWTWERPVLDPIITLGGIGTMILSGALPWRPHVAFTGDAGTGKSQLTGRTGLIKTLLDNVLIDAANATEAGIRQHMGLDALPVSIDEFEASDDNRRAVAIIELARIASSGGRLLRGGADHKGVEFSARNAFFCSGILLPPMKSQDKSRFAVLNLNKLQVGDGAPPVVDADWGRMMLRALMDAWPDFERAYADWRSVLRGSGLDGRAQDTYGTLFAVAELMLGAAALEEMGLPIEDAGRLGEMIAKATAEERAEKTDNWRDCLEHLLNAPIDAWKGGTNSTLGQLIEQIEHDGSPLEHELKALRAVGVAMQEDPDPSLPAGQRRWLLALPLKSPTISKMFSDTRWRDGGYVASLRQARAFSVVRSDTKVVKINRAPMRCLMIDLRAYDKATEG